MWQDASHWNVQFWPRTKLGGVSNGATGDFGLILDGIKGTENLFYLVKYIIITLSIILYIYFSGTGIKQELERFS